MHYLPILKPRPAEAEALGRLSGQPILPLIELIGARPFKPARPETERSAAKSAKPAQEPAEHLKEVEDRFLEHWAEQVTLVDPHHFLNQHPDQLDLLLDTWRTWLDGDLHFLPTIRLTTRAAVRKGLGDLLRHVGSGALRVTSEDLAKTTTAEDIKATLDELDMDAAYLHLVVDCGMVDTVTNDLVRNAAAVINAVASLRFRSITVAATGIGENPQADTQIPRTELELWNRVRSMVPTDVQFGDYGVDRTVKPVPPQFEDTSVIRPSVSLKYTYADSWIYVREGNESVERKAPGAKSFKRGDTKRGDFRKVCQRLVTRPEFMGAAYSEGDAYIHDMAQGTFPTGGTPTAWRLAAFIHHFTFVLDQLTDDPAAIDADDE